MAAERMRERGSTETVGKCIMKELNSTKLIDRSKRMSLEVRKSRNDSNSAMRQKRSLGYEDKHQKRAAYPHL